MSGWKLYGNNGGLQETWTLLTRREWGEDTEWTVQREDSSLWLPSSQAEGTLQSCSLHWAAWMGPRAAKPGEKACLWDTEWILVPGKSVCSSSTPEVTPPQLMPMHAERVHTSPTCPTVRLHSQAEVAEANSSYPL